MNILANYVILFIFSFLAATILPIGSEGYITYLIYNKFNLFLVVIVASVGNFLGATTSYYIGLKGRKHIKKYLKIKEDEIEKAEKHFSKYGSYILLFTWLPFIGDVITVASGVLRINFMVFSIFVFTGKFLRYFAVAYLSGFI